MNGDLLWGRPIRYAGYHIDPKELDRLRQRGDRFADSALESSGSIDNVIDMVSCEHNTDTCGLGESMRTVPEWVDYSKVKRGQLVFLKHTTSASLGLLYYSLVGGFSAPKIVKVLDGTSYLTREVNATFRRLMETFEMVLNCLEDDSLQIGNVGWLHILRVRLLHSSVRSMLLNRGWDSATDGFPINQEDLIATLLSFSINVLDSIKKVEGFCSITREDEDDYLHLWRLIGYYIGIEEEHNPCKSVDIASGAIESIVIHLLHPDLRSGEVARHCLLSMHLRPPMRFSYKIHLQAARFFLGSQLADKLGIEFSFAHYLYFTCVIYLICFFSFLISLSLSTSISSSDGYVRKVRALLRQHVDRLLLRETKTKAS